MFLDDQAWKSKCIYTLNTGAFACVVKADSDHMHGLDCSDTTSAQIDVEEPHPRSLYLVDVVHASDALRNQYVDLQ